MKLIKLQLRACIGRESYARLVDTAGSVDLLFNPLLTLDHIDCHQDTPVEILHTILLGAVKYLARRTFKTIKTDSQVKKIFESRLSALSSVGLSRPINGRRWVAHIGSMVGRDLKAVVQVILFVLHGLVDEHWMRLWQSCATVVVLAYRRNISDIDMYTCLLDAHIRLFLARCAKIDFQILKARKFHFLTHLSFHIRRFGPAPSFATEVFESMNKRLRKPLVNSNRKNPTKDSSTYFHCASVFRHLASGGYFQFNNQWTCAGTKLINAFSDPFVKEMLGFKTRLCRIPGIPRKKEIVCEISHHGLQKAQQLCMDMDSFSFSTCESVSIRDGNTTKTSRFFIFFDDISGVHCVGQCRQIAIFGDQRKQKVLVDACRCEMSGENYYGCPIINILEQRLWIECHDIVSELNVQSIQDSREPPILVMNIFCISTPKIDQVFEFPQPVAITDQELHEIWDTYIRRNPIGRQANLHRCRCRKGCRQRCSCKRKGVACQDFCGCLGLCSNEAIEPTDPEPVTRQATSTDDDFFDDEEALAELYWSEDDPFNNAELHDGNDTTDSDPM